MMNSKAKKKRIDFRVLPHLFQLPLICLFFFRHKYKKDPYLFYSDDKIQILKLLNVVYIDLNKSYLSQKSIILPKINN